MSVFYSDDSVVVHHGDCLDVIATMEAESIDAVVCDPPYGLANTDPRHVIATLGRWLAGERDYLPGGSGFMGKAWDAFVPPPAVWDECLRVLKPGGHLLAFAGSRTQGLMDLSIRLAGFDIRDGIAWLYASGFPKSHDVSKAIDKGEGIWRGRAGAVMSENGSMSAANYERTPKGDPVTESARRWQGWGTALKPAFEPVVMARKPLAGTVAANVLAHGTGALNIDGCRIGAGEGDYSHSGNDNHKTDGAWTGGGKYANAGRQVEPHALGRWPANVVLDEDQAAALDEQSGQSSSRQGINRRGATTGTSIGGGAAFSKAAPQEVVSGHDDDGGASRFFYVAKADQGERIRHDGIAHPTVKPLDLMRWLVRLVTPPGGVVLEPFAGSGTTVEACVLEHFRCVAVEREADYLPLIVQRINRRRNPVAYLTTAGDDLGLFADEGAA